MLSNSSTEHNPDDGVMNRARCANPMLEISDEIETLNWQGIFDQNNFNPLRSLKVDNDLVYNRLLSSNYININPIEGLNLRSTFSIDYAQKQQNKYTPNDIYESERYGTEYLLSRRKVRSIRHCVLFPCYK